MTALKSRVVEAMARAMVLTKAIVHQAALKWCGEKERETFLADMEYFKENWQAFPGLKQYVGREIAQAALTAAVSALAAEGWHLRPDVATEGMSYEGSQAAYDQLTREDYSRTKMSSDIYAAMIAAVPDPFGESGES